MKAVLKFLLGLLEFIIIVFACGMITIMTHQNKYGYLQVGDYTLISIDDVNQTELKDYKVGNLLIIKEAKYKELNLNDKIFYYVSNNSQEYLVYEGTINFKEGDNRTAMYTFKEDNNISVASERVLGTLYKNLDGMGKIINLLTSTIGFLIFVILPILIIFIYQVYKFIILLKEDIDEEPKKTTTKKKEEVKKEEVVSPVKLKPRKKEETHE